MMYDFFWGYKKAVQTQTWTKLDPNKKKGSCTVLYVLVYTEHYISYISNTIDEKLENRNPEHYYISFLNIQFQSLSGFFILFTCFSRNVTSAVSST